MKAPSQRGLQIATTHNMSCNYVEYRQTDRHTDRDDRGDLINLSHAML